jgi:hypothetical protein
VTDPATEMCARATLGKAMPWKLIWVAGAAVRVPGLGYMLAPEQELGVVDEEAESSALLDAPPAAEAPPRSPLAQIRATIGAIRPATFPALSITGMIGVAT